MKASTNAQRQAEQDKERPDTEYKYIVHVRALETFRNIMAIASVHIPDTSSHVSFTSGKRLDLKACKEKGVIWSYSTIRVTRNEDVVEEG